MERHHDHETERSVRVGALIRTAVVLLLAALVLGFALLNTHEVAVDYAFDEAEAPMIGVIAIVGLAGLAVGALAGRRSA